MRRNVCQTLENGWRDILRTILDEGDESSPRGMRTKELVNVSFTLSDPYRNIVWNRARKINPIFSVAEWLWMLLGRNDVASIAYFNKNIAKFSDDGETFYGAYGPRIADQLPQLVQALRKDPDTRQAVMTTWLPNPAPTKDVPCTVAWQFLLRLGRLHAHVFMRSNDAWLGLPYDVFNFTRIQAYIAGLLGVEAGTYTHTVGSLHLYENNWAGAEQALCEPETNPLGEPVSPELTPMPPIFNTAFGTVATEKWASRLYAGWQDGCDAPWSTYLGLLLYKTLKDRALLRAPYDNLIPHAPECLMSGARMIKPRQGLTPCTCPKAAA